MPSLTHEYTPRGGCLSALRYRGSELLLSGPAGTGKSRALLEKLHAIALLNPGMRGLMVRKTGASLTSTGLVTWRERVIPEALRAGHVRYYGGSQEEPAQYRYRNGSRIMIGGMDKPTKIMSSDYDVIYVQEAIELSVTDWESLTTRLRNGRVSFQQLMADTNPDRPEHWLKQRCDSGQTLMIESRHTDNPVYYDEIELTDVREAGDVEANGVLYRLTERGMAYCGPGGVLDGLTGPRRLRLKDGKWVGAEGIVYEEYDPAIHVIDRFDIPEDWPRYWSVDFGFTHPFVLQCWAADPDGRLIRYREIFRTKRTVDQHAVTILAIVREPRPDLDHEPDPRKDDDWIWTEPRPEAIICDHDAEDRATLEKWLGQSTIAAVKKIRPGVQAVQMRLRPAGDGRPRLFLMRDSLVTRDPLLEEKAAPCSTEEEITGYIWNETKDFPVKIRDDGCDALRYMVGKFDLTGNPNIRWLTG
jgi:hypothetical protein